MKDELWRYGEPLLLALAFDVPELLVLSIAEGSSVRGSYEVRALWVRSHCRCSGRFRTLRYHRQLHDLKKPPAFL